MDSCFNKLNKWFENLKEGDCIVYECSHYFKPYPYYIEDQVLKNINNGKIIITKNGLTFYCGSKRINGMELKIENPKDDFLGKGFNKCYDLFKYYKNVSPYQNSLSFSLNNIWDNLEKEMPEHIFNRDWENAMIEYNYLDDNNRINYFKTLNRCIGFYIKDNVLCNKDGIFIKRCSKKIGQYKIFRKSIGENQHMLKWQQSLIYIVNCCNNEVRQETNLCYYYAKYWLEKEVYSYNHKYKITSDIISSSDISSILKRFKEINNLI